jgi:hypothetical protein
MPRRIVTVGSLKALLKDVPDSTPILTGAPDHSYRNAEAVITTAVYYPQEQHWAEDFGDEHNDSDSPWKRYTALVVG